MYKEQQKPDQISYKDTDIYNPNCMTRQPFCLRRSPVVVTLANANLSTVDIQKMMEAGMNVARLRSFGTTTGDKIRLIGKVDKAAGFLAQKHGLPYWPCATAIELKTCIIRTGLLEEEGEYITIHEGSQVVLTSDTSTFDKCNEENIFVDNPHLTAEVQVNMEISIAEEEIILKCIKILSDTSIKCVVKKGGKLKNTSHVCLRGANRTRLNLTEKDLHMIKFAMEYQVDMLFVNYVRNQDTVKKIKKYIGKRWKRPLIIGGLCTPEGLSNIDDVIRECDGILFSREYLTYEVEAPLVYRMARIQKWVMGKCIQAGKPMYISGGVFYYGLIHGVISGKDVSDVSHCILDGVSGFVLKDCTNTDNTLLVINQMNKLCAAVEPFSHEKRDFLRILSDMNLPLNAAKAAAMSCVLVANQVNARVIVLPTVTGRTARIVLWLRPSCVVIGVTTRARSTRILQSCRSVVPLLYIGSPQRTWYLTVQARIDFAIEYAVKKGWLLYQDQYVTLEKGTEESSYCDTVRVWNVTMSKKYSVECPTP